MRNREQVGSPVRLAVPLWHDARGFSLTELLASLAILGMAAGLAFYTVGTGSWRAKSAATELARTLEYCRSRAVLDGHNYVVRFRTDDHSIEIVNDLNSDGDFDQAIGETLTVQYISSFASGTAFGFAATTKGINNVDITSSVDFAGTPPTVTFTRLGNASNGTIYLIPKEDAASGQPQHMRALSVSEATARIRRWRYDARSATPGPWRLEQ